MSAPGCFGGLSGQSTHSTLKGIHSTDDVDRQHDRKRIRLRRTWADQDTRSGLGCRSATRDRQAAESPRTWAQFFCTSLGATHKERDGLLPSGRVAVHHGPPSSAWGQKSIGSLGRDSALRDEFVQLQHWLSIEECGNAQGGRGGRTNRS
jgi:hypothetical protein